MGPDNNRLFLIVSLSSLFFFFYSAEALCLPRNFTNPLGLHHAVPRSAVSFPTPQSTPPASSPPPTKEAPPPKVTHTPVTITLAPPKQEPAPPSKVTHTPVTVTVTPAPPKQEPAPPSNLHNVGLDPAVNNACHATDHPGLCLSSLQPYIQGKVNVFAILDDEIKACKDRAIAASADALKMAQDPRTDAKTASLLKDCKDSYNDALDNLQQAEDAMKTRDIGTVNTMLSAALTDFGDCDDEFSESSSGTQPPAISRDDVTLSDLTSNCLAIASLAMPSPPLPGN